MTAEPKDIFLIINEKQFCLPSIKLKGASPIFQNLIDQAFPGDIVSLDDDNFTADEFIGFLNYVDNNFYKITQNNVKKLLEFGIKYDIPKAIMEAINFITNLLRSSYDSVSTLNRIVSRYFGVSEAKFVGKYGSIFAIEKFGLMAKFTDIALEYAGKCSLYDEYIKIIEKINDNNLNLVYKDHLLWYSNDCEFPWFLSIMNISPENIITIIVNGIAISASKRWLETCSPILKGLIISATTTTDERNDTDKTDKIDDRKIYISDPNISVENFYEFLSFILYGKCKITDENVKELLELGCEHEVSHFSKHCSTYISNMFYGETIEKICENEIARNVSVLKCFGVMLKFSDLAEKYSDRCDLYLTYLNFDDYFGQSENHFMWYSSDKDNLWFIDRICPIEDIFTFVVHGTAISASKYLLIRFSCVLERMINGIWAPADRKIIINDPEITAENFYDFLSHIIYGECNINDSNVEALFHLSHMHHVENLVKKCAIFIEDEIFTKLLLAPLSASYNRILKIIEMSVLYSDEYLIFFSYIKDNIPKIIKNRIFELHYFDEETQQFICFTPEVVKVVVKFGERQKLEEDVLLKNVLDWAITLCEFNNLGVTPRNIKHVAGDILCHINYDDLKLKSWLSQTYPQFQHFEDFLTFLKHPTTESYYDFLNDLNKYTSPQFSMEEEEIINLIEIQK